MLWRMPVDTLKQRIDAMHTAQLSLDAPPPATRVSATNVFHRSKRTALTALTALTPAMGRPSGTRDWHSGSGNCGNPTDAQRRRPPGNSAKRSRKGGQDGGQESPSAGLVAYSLPYMPVNGGWGGIRTHGALARTPVFKTGALNRSATHPGCACYSVRDGGYISDRRHKYC